MKKYKLTIEYEGTRYSGWQLQKNSKSVQGAIASAVENIIKTSKFELMGAGRTDKGVHALQQVAHLTIDKYFKPQNLRYALNDLLPYDINILNVEETDLKFHARHDAISRSYIYQITNERTAFLKPFVWWVKDELNYDKIIDTAKVFIGMHDFRNFAKLEDKGVSPKVLVEDIQTAFNNGLFVIRIVASHFLWNMVRRIVGTLVEVGRGNLSKNEIINYLENKKKIEQIYTAPPSGLFLEKIIYDKKEKIPPLQPAILRRLY
ncbi:MAG TPA: tRNA pseudouridine(38-40) synthase TruA [Ignavibacteriales bacterium]|nr:tRNA pseudouridine(38-40) synthase TruA [Ignavibacteriales bacterium]HOL80144.1 tRNA pseudouridine(38-40) synthase TruA [Ignavibacteriales bacterium]HOM64426.1 tRNA pseudouridine(38-40) synthase TruA [Ignavibacteriales bacterium]HPD67913.1 tRNA pseudouridine(38-40) synthase TruA [Ignavibacteriales bacterium]HPP32333.1 tRNA pseudouridine(38-40) synthase TruA [Ignavibacteriales bacterium]